MIKFDFDTYTKNIINNEELELSKNKINEIHNFLEQDYMMGWYNLDKLFDQQLLKDINETATYIRDNCDVFLVIGIGGSYLGTMAAVEALKPHFYNKSMKPQIYFVGTNLSSSYYHDLINVIKDKDIIVNVISKSGSTLETLISYQLIMDLMNKKYNEEELKKRIIITTSDKQSSLKSLADEKGYKQFAMPDDVGGRYSVLTTVGLLPMAVSNINIDELYIGAKRANEDIMNQIKYAVIRKKLNDQGKSVEAYVVYEPKLYSLTEWLKQLYGESLGKKGRGILPIALINTRDLHSLGQFLQDGSKIIFETVINIKKSQHDIEIPMYSKSLDEINAIASQSTSMAHSNSGVPSIVITADELNESTLGYLFQFFMISCAISGYIEGVNPFDQEGVEEYKQIMRSLLNQ